MTQLDDLKRILRKEGILLATLGFVGLVVLPACIYLVGHAVFGEYAPGGFGAFFGSLHRELRNGQPVVLLLLLSPYLLWQFMRLVAWGFRRLGAPAAPHA